MLSIDIAVIMNVTLILYVILRLLALLMMNVGRMLIISYVARVSVALLATIFTVQAILNVLSNPIERTVVKITVKKRAVKKVCHVIIMKNVDGQNVVETGIVKKISKNVTRNVIMILIVHFLLQTLVVLFSSIQVYMGIS